MGLKEQLDLLLILQEVDRHIDNLDAQKISIPQMLDGEKQKIAAKESEIAGIKKAVTESQKNKNS